MDMRHIACLDYSLCLLCSRGGMTSVSSSEDVLTSSIQADTKRINKSMSSPCGAILALHQTVSIVQSCAGAPPTAELSLQGFYPKAYDSSMAWRWYKPTLGVSSALILVKLVALATFTVYTCLAYKEGRELASTLSGKYSDLAAMVNQQYISSQSLQSLIDGDLRVAGRMYSSAFVGDVPAVLPPAKVSQAFVRRRAQFQDIQQ